MHYTLYFVQYFETSWNPLHIESGQFLCLYNSMTPDILHKYSHFNVIVQHCVQLVATLRRVMKKNRCL